MRAARAAIEQAGGKEGTMETKPAPAQHTPGLWRRGAKYNEVIAGPDVDPVHICALDLGPFGAKDTRLQPGDVEANARLIAAAPALLEACKEAREALRLSAPLRKGDGPKLCHAFISVATAITQAGGKP